MNSVFSSYCRLGLIGLLTGLINGLLGIGGGTILIPAMVFLLGEEQHVAHGTSLAVILPTALMSTLIYQYNSHIDWVLAAKIAATSTEEDICQIEFLNPKVNERMNKKVFDFKIPKGFGEEIVPLKKS